ncbi:MAG: cisplatin damage response ATP-dependent DNA ligase [Bryobacterales bacterium]|nr:cisplatin damage response ATP-dependent DNA ligase [Bryobacteraceae bacterium]MDW8130144.1 cisplatin damage response ATP-dependent DNA ligase [Bryobacterales bacterium]
MDELAELAERVASRSGRREKVALVASYLSALGDEDLGRAIRFLSGRPFGPRDPRRLAVGHVSLREAVTAASGWDAETVTLSIREVGDIGEAIGLLMRGKTAERPLSLAEAESLYRELARRRGAVEKEELLRECFLRYRPLTLKYFVKVITGDLRIGLHEKMLLEAVAAACGVKPDALRAAAERTGDPAEAALAARHGRLEQISTRLFRPLDFMLARPIASAREVPDPENWLVEDKYDGIRAQAHVAAGRAALFSRGLADVTQAFPDLAAALERLPGSAVLDGEVVAWREGRALPFTALQQRLARKAVPLFLPLEAPAAYVAYDLLLRDGRELMELPIEERRAELERLLAGHDEPLLVAPQRQATDQDELVRLFAEARARGNEGLVLKRRGSRYEAGRRGGAWLKWKQPLATLDVVITAAEQGHGKRATLLSDYTFAVRSGDRFVNVGKAYSGLTDQEIRELTERLRALATARAGPILLVRPEIVLEVAFDGVQKSQRHESGYALRFPRIVRWRRDKRPEDVDSLERVRQIWEASLSSPGRSPSR